MRDQRLPGRLAPYLNGPRIWRSASSRRGEKVLRETGPAPESVLHTLEKALEFQRRMVDLMSAGAADEVAPLLRTRNSLLRRAGSGLAEAAARTEAEAGEARRSREYLERLAVLGRELGRLEAKIDRLSETSASLPRPPLPESSSS